MAESLPLEVFLFTLTHFVIIGCMHRLVLFDSSSHEFSNSYTIQSTYILKLLTQWGQEEIRNFLTFCRINNARVYSTFHTRKIVFIS